MAQMDFDLIVIGSGPGGYSAANRASQLGMKVAVVERQSLGGICLNWGCIPTKSLLSSAKVYQHVLHAKDYGISTGEVGFDFAKIMQRSRKIAERMNKGIQYLFEKYKVTHITGAAAFKDAHTLTISQEGGAVKTLTGKNIIIATGARPRALPGVEFDGKKILNYFHALSLEQAPASVIIVGAGAIGVEFAYFWNCFGAKVTLVELLPQLLPIEDSEIAEELEKHFKRSKINIQTGAKVAGIKTNKQGVEVTIEKSGKQEILQADCALIAIGVQANSENMNLENIGVTIERGFIGVDKSNYQTSVSHIFAVGDCINTPLLAHVASAEGIACVEKMAGHGRPAVDYGIIPSCTYCQPEVASVGLTEQAARDKGYKIKIGKFPFRASGRAVASGETDGMVKIVFDESNGAVLGAHIICNEATELIAELTLAKNYELTQEEIIKTMHAHPTLSEGIMEATAAAYCVSVNL